MKLLRLILVIALLVCPVVTGRAGDGVEHEQSSEIDVGEILFGHIGDSYGWHITDWKGKHVTIPLPCIVHSSTGWHFFMSSKIEHGHEHEGLFIAEEGRYEDKIVERGADGELVRPFDISITKMVNDDIIRPSVGEKHYRKYSPYLLTAFFFIFVCNLMGLIPFFPGGANVTGNIAVTMMMALFTFIAINVFADKHYWKEILWPDVPMFLKFPIPIMQTIEIFGVISKPFSLMVRLFANIMAGHMMVLGLVSVIFVTVKLGPVINGSMTVIAMLFGLVINCLELLVAFIQAYVFTMLSAVFIGMAHQEEH